MRRSLRDARAQRTVGSAHARRARRTIATAILVLGLLGVASASAQAAGFGYSFSFAPENGFSVARSAAVDQSTGNVFISDVGSSLLWKFNVNVEGKSAAPDLSFGSGGNVGVPGGTPFQPSVDYFPGGHGEVFVPSLEGGTVTKFGAAGESLLTISGLTLPISVSVDENGFIYVAELFGSVRKFNAAGNPVNVAGVESSENVVITAPGLRGMAIEPSANRIYIASIEPGEGVLQYTLSEGAYAQTAQLDPGVQMAGVALAPSTPASPTAGDVFAEPYTPGSEGEVLVYEPSGALVTRFGGSPISGEDGRLAVYGTLKGSVVFVPNVNSVAVFTEGEAAEEPITEPATEIESTAAQLHGELNPGGATGQLRYFFAYNLASEGTCKGGSTVPASPAEVAEGKEAKVSAEATHLQANTEYTFCAVAQNSFGPTYGPQLTFKTAPYVPAVSTVAEARSITRTSALLTGAINPERSETFYAYEYECVEGAVKCVDTGTHRTPTQKLPFEANEEPGHTPMPTTPEAITELQPGATYIYWLATNNKGGESESAVGEFTTAPPTPAIVSGEFARVTSPTTATVGGEIDPQGLPTTYTVEIASVLGQDGQPIYGPQSFGQVPEGGGTVSVALTGLQPGVTYYFRLVATSSEGPSRGGRVTFTTPGFPALVLPPAPVQIIPFNEPEPPKKTAEEIRKEKYNHAVAQCNKKKNKRKRAACLRTARKRFGPIKKK